MKPFTLSNEWYIRVHVQNGSIVLLNLTQQRWHCYAFQEQNMKQSRKGGCDTELMSHCNLMPPT